MLITIEYHSSLIPVIIVVIGGNPAQQALEILSEDIRTEEFKYFTNLK